MYLRREKLNCYSKLAKLFVSFLVVFAFTLNCKSLVLNGIRLLILSFLLVLSREWTMFCQLIYPIRKGLCDQVFLSGFELLCLTLLWNFSFEFF